VRKCNGKGGCGDEGRVVISMYLWKTWKHSNEEGKVYEGKE
jgi:hypothetical protein